MNIAEKLTKVAENEKKVHDAGYTRGKQAQYDLFWDVFQQKGNRTNYQYAFANWDGCSSIFKPKYDIRPTGTIGGLFYGFETFLDLQAVCEEQGIVIDFSKVTSFQNFMAASCAIYRIGVVDCSSVTSMALGFNQATSLKTIDKLILHEGITTYQDCFANTSLLQNITIEGTIAGTGFNVQHHKNLTHDSLMSIINALKDYNGTTTTKTITLGATNLAKLTDNEKAIATQRGWTLA